MNNFSRLHVGDLVYRYTILNPEVTYAFNPVFDELHIVDINDSSYCIYEDSRLYIIKFNDDSIPVGMFENEYNNTYFEQRSNGKYVIYATSKELADERLQKYKEHVIEIAKRWVNLYNELTA